MPADHPTLKTARTVADILEAVARFVWWERHPGEDCPDKAIPSETALLEWLEEWWREERPITGSGRSTAEVCREASTCLKAVLGGAGDDACDRPDPAIPTLPGEAVLGGAGDDTWVWRAFRGRVAQPPLGVYRAVSIESDDGTVVISHLSVSARIVEWSAGESGWETWAFDGWVDLCSVHERWCAMPKKDRPRHPLAPLMSLWLDRAETIRAETRADRIIPQGLIRARPSVIGIVRDETRIPGFTGRVDESGSGTQLILPGFDPAPSSLVPVTPLLLADAAGLGNLKPGRGARQDKRILLFSLLAMPRDQRRPGGRYELRRTLRQVVHEWLYPPENPDKKVGRENPSSWKPSRYGENLRRALNAVSVAGVLLPDGSEWRPAIVRQVPNMADLESELIIELRLPDESDRGPLVSMPWLVAEGTVSDPRLDAVLSLAYLWDDSKRRAGGSRVYAEVPEVLRDERERLLDADGTVITGPDPDLPEWRWRLSKGRKRSVPSDQPATAWSDSRAVPTGKMARHPNADRVPVLSPEDRRRMFYGPPGDKPGPTLARERKRADTVLEEWTADGRIVIEATAAGWRLLEPRPERERSG